MGETWTPEQYRAHFNKQKQKETRLKFGNIPVPDLDGMRFDSKKEAEVYGKLKLAKKAGHIKDFTRGKKRILEVKGIVITTYKSDFEVTENDGSLTVIDVKGAATAELYTFKIKRRLMLAIYNISVKIV